MVTNALRRSILAWGAGTILVLAAIAGLLALPPELAEARVDSFTVAYSPAPPQDELVLHATTREADTRVPVKIFLPNGSLAWEAGLADGEASAWPFQPGAGLVRVAAVLPASHEGVLKWVWIGNATVLVGDSPADLLREMTQ